MANAMTLMNGAIAAALREAIQENTFDSRVKASFFFGRKSTEFFHGWKSSRAWEPYSDEPMDISSGASNPDNIDKLKKALDYDKSQGLKSIWFNPSFVKPAIVGLSIWMDRISNPDNTTTLTAVVRRTEKTESAYGFELLDLSYNATSTVSGAAEEAERRAGAALVAGAWWSLNSSTAQRLGFVALAAEAERHRSTHISDPTSNVPSDGRYEIGDSPYVIIKEN